MGPLTDIRVVDFTHGVAGPVATMLLADLGCDVVKIERPQRGDATRYMNVSNRFMDDIPNSGGDYFLSINRNKRSVTLNLKTDEGRDTARKLSEWADVVVSNFRPGVMDRLGLGYDRLRETNPNLIYATLSAYGEKGPLAGQPGMDVAVQARSGLMSITGAVGSTEPIKAGASLADFSGGVHLTVAIQGALFHRERTGEGQRLEVSLLDATMNMLSNYSVAVIDGGAELSKMGSGHPQIVPFQAFETADGSFVLSAGTNRLFKKLCDLLGLPHYADDPKFATNQERVKHRDELIPVLARIFLERPTDEWLSLFRERDMPCAPVQTLKEGFADPQLVANDMVQEIDHPTHGSMHVLGVPYKFGSSTCSVRLPPPTLGQHTEEVLRDVLGMSDDDLTSLRGSAAI